MLDAIAVVAHQYLDMGAIRVARALFEGLCAVCPDWPYPHLGLGVCRLQQGATREAREAFQRAAELDPSDPDALLHLAEIAIHQRQFGAADRWLRRARQIGAATDADARRARALARIVRER